MTGYSSAIEYCRYSQREIDYEHYLISLMMPKTARPALWAIGAFKIIIENIPAQVSEPTLGLIRLAWWRDQIALLNEGKITQGQPALSALAETIPQDIFPLLIEFINEQEAAFEVEQEKKISSAMPLIYEKTLKPDYPRFRSLQNNLTALLKKYHGTRWEKHPPFLAFRLWLGR